MSYQYSNGLCHEARRFLTGTDELESRISRAFSEMGVSRDGDTSDEIWRRWKELQKRYHVVNGEIYRQRQEGVNTNEMVVAIEEFGESLLNLIGEWIEYNEGQIAKGVLVSPKKPRKDA